jgi:hypothetical protein
MQSALAVLAVAMSLVAPAVSSAAHHRSHPHAAKKHHALKAHTAAMACRARVC